MINIDRSIFTVRKMLFICFLLIRFPAFSQNDSQVLNKTGYQEMVRAHYEEAMDFFTRAIEADDNNVYAHHNMACVLALNYWKSDIHEIIRHLKKEVELQPKRIEKILSDHDLDNIRKQKAFINFILDGHTIDKVLSNPAPGSCAGGCDILFHPDGSIEFYEVWEGYEGDTRLEKPTFTGYYAIMDTDIIVYFPGISKNSAGTIQEAGSNSCLYGSPDNDFYWGTYEEGRIMIHDFSEGLHQWDRDLK